MNADRKPESSWILISCAVVCTEVHCGCTCHSPIKQHLFILPTAGAGSWGSSNFQVLWVLVWGPTLEAVFEADGVGFQHFVLVSQAFRIFADVHEGWNYALLTLMLSVLRGVFLASTQGEQGTRYFCQSRIEAESWVLLHVWVPVHVYAHTCPGAQHAWELGYIIHSCWMSYSNPKLWPQGYKVLSCTNPDTSIFSGSWWTNQTRWQVLSWHDFFANVALTNWLALSFLINSSMLISVLLLHVLMITCSARLHWNNYHHFDHQPKPNFFGCSISSGIQLQTNDSDLLWLLAADWCFILKLGLGDWYIRASLLPTGLGSRSAVRLVLCCGLWVWIVIIKPPYFASPLKLTILNKFDLHHQPDTQLKPQLQQWLYPTQPIIICPF